MKNKIIFSVAVLLAWFITINLPIWRLELPGVNSGYSLLDSMSTLVNDNYHLSFMYFSGPVLAIVALINPKKYLIGTFGIYILILICGFLGFAFSPDVALKWGWYVHFVVMIAVVVAMGGKFLPEAFEKDE
ncbi:hypothetical protein OAV92_01795 [Crocinitomicaceae bacterium]|nr:hypothetical protein [Crocinitomicaceae bacterium]